MRTTYCANLIKKVRGESLFESLGTLVVIFLSGSLFVLKDHLFRLITETTQHAFNHRAANLMTDTLQSTVLFLQKNNQDQSYACNALQMYLMKNLLA